MSQQMAPVSVSGPVGGSVTWLARIVAFGGHGAQVSPGIYALVPSDVAAIACNVFDLSSATPDVAAASPSITADAISSELSQNAWTDPYGQPMDSLGGNFMHSIDGAVFALADHVYRCEYLITLGDGSIIPPFHFDNVPHAVT